MAVAPPSRAPRKVQTPRTRIIVTLPALRDDGLGRDSTSGLRPIEFLTGTGRSAAGLAERPRSMGARSAPSSPSVLDADAGRAGRGVPERLHVRTGRCQRFGTRPTACNI